MPRCRLLGNRRGLLWVHSNGSTPISQIVNTIIFNTITLAEVYSTSSLLSIIVSSYLIYIVRLLKEKDKIPE
ncbi:MAG: VUT family protein [Clostridia bacterium]|nr:VUT family protein [Clostridia bacterium]